MLWKILIGIVLVAGAALGARQFLVYAGWQPIHAAEFASDDCAVYHVMRGMEQDPTKDPANAKLLEKCGTEYIRWSLSQVGDGLRFDRPARIRLRIDPIDMQRFSNYPTLIAEFPYPPVALPASFRLRQWGSPVAADVATSAQLLRPMWSPPWAELLARWSLGRGKQEVWLGGATIADPKYCERVEHDDQRHEDFCWMTMLNAVTKKPFTFRLPLTRMLQVRLEMLEICRFGGNVRQWQQPWLVKLFGAATEYTDRGCVPF